MKVLIVGAADELEQAISREALKHDHQVTTFSQEKTLSQGALDQPLLDQDAVICCMEKAWTRQPVTLFSEGTGNLIRAMQRHNVRRLLCVTGVGAGNSVGHGGFVFDRILQPFQLRTVLEDKTRQEKLVQACDRDWLIVRPARLTGDRARARFSVVLSTRGLATSGISRADVAVWTVAQLMVNKFLYKAVVLTE